MRIASRQKTNKGVEAAREILHAARELFAMHGWAQLSMRGVAARVGVTLGSVQHYYSTKESLIEAMLVAMLEDMQRHADAIAHADPQATPVEQFREAMRYFISTLHAPIDEGTFVELKALARRDRAASAAMESIFLDARKSIGQRIRAMLPKLDRRTLNVRAALVLAQLLGLTYLQPGAGRRRRADLAGIDRASVDLMLAIALGR